MRVVQVKCPKCNAPIVSKQKDMLFLCNQCNTMHMREEGVEVIPFEIAEFHPNIHGDDVYIPFWKMNATFEIRYKRSEGGLISKLASFLKAGSNTGNIAIYIPATDLDTATFRRLVSLFLSNPPRYSTRFNFGGVRNMPCTVTRREAAELADFAVVTMEADEPGVLQMLDYSLRINDSKIVYLPFVVTPAGLNPAL
jgi:endogenous inhibitor of DNA gyrase (YacG/DUF329 family)